MTAVPSAEAAVYIAHAQLQIPKYVGTRATSALACTSLNNARCNTIESYCRKYYTYLDRFDLLRAEHRRLELGHPKSGFGLAAGASWWTFSALNGRPPPPALEPAAPVVALTHIAVRGLQPPRHLPV